MRRRKATRVHRMPGSYSSRRVPAGLEGWARGACLVLEPAVADGLEGLAVGDRLVVLPWLDRADRTVLRTHPRGDLARPEQGVFVTRSPDTPNPLGLHNVSVLAVDARRIRVGPLEALDGTPVVDLKPALTRVKDR